MGTCQGICNQRPKVTESGESDLQEPQSNRKGSITVANSAVRDLVFLAPEEEEIRSDHSIHLKCVLNESTLGKGKSFAYFQIDQMDTTNLVELEVTDKTAHKDQHDDTILMGQLDQQQRSPRKKSTKKNREGAIGSPRGSSMVRSAAGSLMGKYYNPILNRSVHSALKSPKPILKESSMNNSQKRNGSRKVRFKKVPDQNVMKISAPFANRNYIIKL